MPASTTATRASSAVTKLLSLFPQRSSLAKRKNHPPDILSEALCGQILERLDLSAYKKTHIIDMNPGMGIWSSKLHAHLKPQQHTLLEPQEAYLPVMEQFTMDHKNSYHVPLDGYNWETYNKLFALKHPNPPFPKDFPGFNVKGMKREDGVNTKLLFVGNIGASVRGERLLAQFIDCCAMGGWVQKYGRVRFLVWVSDAVKERILPRSIAARGRLTVVAEAVADVVEVAGCNVIRSGKGFHRRPTIGEKDPKEGPTEEAPPERQEPKSVAKVRKGHMEDEIRRLVSEEMGLQLRTGKRGRPKKLTAAEQAKIDQLETKVKKRVESLRAATSLASLSETDKQELLKMRQSEKEKVESFLAVQKRTTAAMKERVKKKKVSKPYDFTTSGKTDWRKVDMVKVNKAIEKLEANPGVWVYGMEHPAWYYNTAQKKRALARRIVEISRDAGFYAKTHDVSPGIKQLDSILPAPPVTTTEESRESFREFEKLWLKRPGVVSRNSSREDEISATQEGLLQHYQRPYEPILIDPKTDLYPHTPLTLLDITPKLPDPYFSAAPPDERQVRWDTFDWLVRNLFVLRAGSVSGSLRSLAAGGENVLKELPPEEYIDPDKRVRTMTTPELINLTKAWQRWPFKPHDVLYHQFLEKNAYGDQNVLSVSFGDRL